MVAGTVFKWSIVITRFGKPSSSEIRGGAIPIYIYRLSTSLSLLPSLLPSPPPTLSISADWPKIVDDGLLMANQYLRGNECDACGLAQAVRPHLSNVLMLSVQPETHIQLFPSNDHTPTCSHVMVLPQVYKYM